MKLITLLCVCLSITAGTWAYSPKCAQGPKYWCRDAATARECGAVQRCEQTVWRAKESAKKPSTTGETAHMLCNVLVEASSELLAAGSIHVDSIKEYIRQDCTKLPNQANLVQQCEMAVDIYLADILRHLTSGTESSKICSIIQGHDTASMPIVKPKPSGVSSNQTCVLCEFVVQILATVASANASAQELAHILENICHEMPAVLRDECTSFVSKYGVDIIALLVRGFDPAKVCTLIKLCTKSQNVDFLIKPSAEKCGLCDYVSTSLSAGLPKENVCKNFATENNLKEQCEVLVHLYKPNLCAVLPLCSEEIQPLEQSLSSSVQSAECSLCKYVVNYVDAVIQTNKSEAAIEAALEKVCTILPAPIRAPCKTFVDTYGPLLVQLIQKYGTADKVCDALKLCNNGTQVHTPLETLQGLKLDKKSLGTIPCLICKYVIGYLETATQGNRSTAAIEAALEKVCNVLPAALKDQCTTFVNKYGPIIALLFKQNATALQICDFIKVCNNGTQVHTPLEILQGLKLDKKSLGTIPCLICKYVIGYLETATQGNRSTAAIEAALEKVCNVLPAALKDQCTTFVNKYGPIIALLFKQNATALQICDFIKVCNNGTQTALPHGLDLITSSVEGSVKSVQCALCKYIVGYIDTVIQNNKSEAAIEAALEKVCSIVPATLKNSCIQFVDTYGPILVQLIEKYATAEQVCNALKMCHNGTEAITPLLSGLTRTIEEKKVAANGLECSLCKYVVSYIDNVIQNNKSEAAIEAALEKVCTIVPAAIKDKCIQFVDTYGPILAQLIAKYATAEQVCNALKVCHNGTEAITPLVSGLTRMIKEKKPAANGIECSLCKYVVSYIDSVIQNNKSEAAIEAALEKVCTIVPAAIKDKCLQFVDTYGPILAQLIAKYATPEQVCNALKVCHNGTQSTESLLKGFAQELKSTARAIKSPGKLASAECSLCKYVVNYVDAVIQTNKSEAAIEAALEKVCTILPAPIRAPCKTFVDTYGPLLVQLIQKYGTADKVCDALKLCNNGTQIAEPISQTITKSVRRLKDGGECTLCKYILNYVNLLIKSNVTAEELKKALDVVCSILPAADHDQCKTFVKNYAPILAELIAELDDPNTICQWLGLCSKSDKSFIQIPAVKRSKAQSLPCNLCEYVVHYLDAIVQSNSTETKFEDALDKACKVLPEKKLEMECRVLVRLYGGDLIKFLVEYGDPKAVCEALKICDK